MEYRWMYSDGKPSDEIKSLYHPAIAHTLARRGISTKKDAEFFLFPDYNRDSHDPFLFDDMVLAVDRISQSLSSNEKIGIYCDYDVDGLSSGAILYSTLRQLGCTVEAYMNHRELDGYGLQKKGIDVLVSNGVKLIITTDCGISNAREIAYAKQYGVDVIITDHHTVPEREEDIPASHAIIHPLVRASAYPWKSLAGGGSAFKLAQALIRTNNPHISKKRAESMESEGGHVNWEAFEKWLLDLVSLSTIGDCVPLQGENRALVYYGLKVLAKTRRTGLRSLLERYQKRNQPLNARAISFFFAPRINAASRMDHARIAFDLLTATDELEAEKIADTLEKLNSERQKLTEKVLSSARDQLDIYHSEQKKILVGLGERWPLGILGLVAGRLCDYYQKPVVLMTSGDGGISGAARSTEDFHIAEAFGKIRHHFDRYGGHQAAGGFAVKKEVSGHAVRESLEELAENRISSAEQQERVLHIDAELKLSDITFELLSDVLRMEPHGVGNPRPRFLIQNAMIEKIKYMGQTGKHIRLDVRQGQSHSQFVGFSFADKIQGMKQGSVVDAVCELDSHEWMGRKSVQVSLVDIRESNEAPL